MAISYELRFAIRLVSKQAAPSVNVLSHHRLRIVCFLFWIYLGNKIEVHMITKNIFWCYFASFTLHGQNIFRPKQKCWKSPFLPSEIIQSESFFLKISFKGSFNHKLWITFESIKWNLPGILHCEILCLQNSLPSKFILNQEKLFCLCWLARDLDLE